MKSCLKWRGKPLTFRAIALIFLFSLAAPGSFAASLSFSVEPKVGLSFGQVSEIVYPVGYTSKNKYLSELKWDIQPAVMLGLALRMRVGEKFGLYVDLQGALPLESGKMVDYDWLYLSLEDVWSHRSISKITIENGYIFDFFVDWRFGKKPFKLVLGMGYHFDLWRWEDNLEEYTYTTDAGGGLYPDLPGDITTGDFTTGDPLRNSENQGDGEPSINYMVAFNVPYLAIGFVYDQGLLFAGGRFAIGPVFASGYDQHLRRNLRFYDVAVGGPWFSVDGQIGINFSDFLRLYLDGNLVFMLETKGDSRTESDIGTLLGISSQGGGFNFWRASVQLGMAFQF